MAQLKSLFYQSLMLVLCSILSYAFITGSMDFAKEERLPTPTDANKCLLFSIAIIIFALGLGGIWKRPVDSIFAWHTPLTTKLLYRRFFMKNAFLLLWTLVIMPIAILSWVDYDSPGLQLAACLAGILFISILAVSGFTAPALLPTSYIRASVPLVMLPLWLFQRLFGLGQKINQKVAALITTVASLSVLAILFLPHYFPLATIGAFLLTVSDSLRAIPIVGVIMSYLWCPLLEIGRLITAPHQQQTELFALITFQITMLLLHIPALRRMINDDEPAWRRKEELLDFSALIKDEDAESRTSPASPNAIPNQGLAASGNIPSLLDRLTNAWIRSKNDIAFSRYIYALFFIVFFSFSNDNFSLSRGLTKVIFLLITCWTIFPASMHVLAKQEQLAWWPLDRSKVLREAFLGKWWGWAMVASGLLALYFVFKWPVYHLLWMLPAFLFGRTAIPALIILSQHHPLGRKAMGWLHISTCILALIGIFPLAIQHATHGWDLSDPYRAQWLAACGICFLIPVATALYCLRHETKATSRQLYSPLEKA